MEASKLILFVLIRLTYINADVVNVAIGKTTTQSGELWPSRNAVDGIKYCPVVNGTYYTLTDDSHLPSWQVDLGDLFRIEQINIFGRHDSIINQLQGFRLYLSHDNFSEQSRLVYTNIDSNNGFITVTSVPTGLYRYVKLDLPGTYRSYAHHQRIEKQEGPVVLCEVEVLVNAKNVAVGKNVTMSSYISSWDPYKAVDNITDQEASTCDCCSHSSDSKQPWLTVNLGKQYTIIQIKAIGRYDEDHRENRQLYGLKIVTNGSDNLWSDDNASTNLFRNTITFNPTNLSSQFVTLRRPGPPDGEWFLVVCELQIFVRECDSGTYGIRCEHKCGYCKRLPCDAESGFGSDGECLAGWSGKTCKTCAATTFGEECSSVCHCKNDAACSDVDGRCPEGGCAPGWQGSACDTKCANNTFGPDCAHQCHCANNSPCDSFNGHCSAGCDIGWTDTGCNVEENIMHLLNISVKTTMSSIASNRTSDLAIDGNIGPDPDQCQCCSETENAQLSWWIVDFGQTIPVRSVIIYSRNNENSFHHLDGFQLSLSNNILYNSTLFRLSNTVMSGKMYRILLPNVLTRQIKIQRPGVLAFCEVKVYKGVCEVGAFGYECSKKCHCADNQPCAQVTGLCQNNACKTGWRGSACDEKCLPDTFGDECREKCYCEVGTCTSNYGICTGKCRRGYYGPHCNLENAVDLAVGFEIQNQTDDHFNCKKDYNIAVVVVGAVGGSAAVIFVAVGVIIFRFRKRKSRTSKNENATASFYVTPTHSPNYDTLDIQNDNQGSSNNEYENEEVASVISQHHMNASIQVWYLFNFSSSYIFLFPKIVKLVLFSLSKEMMGTLTQPYLCIVLTYGLEIYSQRLDNLALYKPTAQLGIFHYPPNNPHALWLSSNAVDGLKVCPVDADYKHYSATEVRAEPWWQVDLGDVYLIANITVYGRPSQPPVQLHGFNVHLSLDNQVSSANIIYNNKVPYGNGIFTDIIASGKVYHARYVTIVLPVTSVRIYDSPLVLCEVEVYGVEKQRKCDIGRFGYGCLHHCHCSDKKACNSVSGRCKTPGCLPGWQGYACDKGMLRLLMS
ncbi:uncharacterized protein LOC123558234 [Mercenaria mercenaria]|uniref:uncharacterized protein LOC123558234 n=1 Tax=Mercenaria mercenaria TaxID=6596 RepID=UPI00234E5431|nr:uncharacterized protein LOC123558234 [Mercenaria mercenaria]